MKIVILFLIICFGESVLAQVGSRYAIEKYSKTQGLKVNPKALQRMGVETKQVSSWPLVVNEEAVIFIKDQAYVYLSKNDFFVLAIVSPKKMTGTQWEISGDTVKVGDMMVIKKAELLHLGQILNQAEE